jgi:hypothetical protein
LRSLTRWKRFLFGRAAIPGVQNSIRGKYDLRGDRLWGWIEGLQTPGDGQLKIEARRHNEVIAACGTVPEPLANRHTFTLSIDGRFAEPELISEAVVIIARNDRGDTGTLRLDGTTQLGLIRASFAEKSEAVLDLDFTLGGNATSCCRSGWSNAERDFTWSEGHDSIILFNTPHKAGTYALRTTAGAFIHGATAPAQVMQIFINDTELQTIQFTERRMQFHETKFAGALFTTKPQTELRFHYPYPIRPSELLGNNSDQRRLAFCFKRLTVVRILPE